MPLNLALLFCVIATMFFVFKKIIILCLILCVVYFQCCWTACFNGDFCFLLNFPSDYVLLYLVDEEIEGVMIDFEDPFLSISFDLFTIFAVRCIYFDWT